ncbi:MAG: uroporphyrinogen decarboxylase family protein [Candidatus Omnitrophota bacterium]
MPFDWQSPHGVACMLMSNENLMMAMYDTPELVHELFRRVTQAIIDLVRAAQNCIGRPKGTNG